MLMVLQPSTKVDKQPIIMSVMDYGIYKMICHAILKYSAMLHITFSVLSVIIVLYAQDQ